MTADLAQARADLRPVHYAVTGGFACGDPGHGYSTTSVKDVTCKNCWRTIPYRQAASRDG